MTCAVECRSTSRPSGDAGTTISSRASWSIGVPRSTHSPSTRAASASLASRLPIDTATSAGVVPFATSLVEPSGSVTVISESGISRETLLKAFPDLGRVRSPLSGQGTFEVDAEQRGELAERRRRARVVAAREDRAREVVERLDGPRRVEVVVDRGPHTVGVRTRIGARVSRGRGAEAVEQRGALLEIGLVPLEVVAIVVAEQRKADRARVGALEQVADEHEVAERLAHLLALVADHRRVHPVARERLAGDALALR